MQEDSGLCLTIRNKTLIHADSKWHIATLENRSIDLIHTDPPYSFISRFSSRRDAMAELEMRDVRYYVEQFNRVLKRGGSVVLWCNDATLFRWIDAFRRYFKPVQLLVWVYRNTPAHEIKKIFRPGVELAVWMCRKHEEPITHYRGKQVFNWHFEPAYGGILSARDGVPEEKLGVTPKPLRFLKEINRFLCPDDGVVYDPFMGLASIGVASEHRYIGVEIDFKVFEHACSRVYHMMNQKTLKEVVKWHTVRLGDETAGM